MNAEQKALYIRDHSDIFVEFAHRILNICEAETDEKAKEEFKSFTNFSKIRGVQLIIHEQNGRWLG